MNIKNHEFKAKVDELAQYENTLLKLNPEFKGTDRQIDTYFNVESGRLKLREGNIENSLIQYHRPDTAESKLSHIVLYQHEPDPALKAILTHQLGIKVVVDKLRKIYFLDNVKFHFDEVMGLGTFLEVEAIDSKEAFTEAQLKQQCNQYFDFFGLNSSHLVDQSYSDLIQELQQSD